MIGPVFSATGCSKHLAGPWPYQSHPCLGHCMEIMQEIARLLLSKSILHCGNARKPFILHVISEYYS